jgi:hypothetical protein
MRATNWMIYSLLYLQQIELFFSCWHLASISSEVANNLFLRYEQFLVKYNWQFVNNFISCFKMTIIIKIALLVDW